MTHLLAVGFQNSHHQKIFIFIAAKLNPSPLQNLVTMGEPFMGDGEPIRKELVGTYFKFLRTRLDAEHPHVWERTSRECMGGLPSTGYDRGEESLGDVGDKGELLECSRRSSERGLMSRNCISRRGFPVSVWGESLPAGDDRGERSLDSVGGDRGEASLDDTEDDERGLLERPDTKSCDEGERCSDIRQVYGGESEGLVRVRERSN